PTRVWHQDKVVGDDWRKIGTFKHFRRLDAMRQVFDNGPATALGAVPVYGVKRLGTVSRLDFERPDSVFLAERLVPGEVVLGHFGHPSRVAVKRQRIPVVKEALAILGGQAGRFGCGANDD